MTTALLAHDPLNSARPLDALSIATLAYLALPNFIFFAGWLRWPFAIFFSLLVASSIFVALDWRRIVWTLPYRAPVCLTIVVGAFVWSAFGGAGHFGAATIDWQIRDAVLGDLIHGDWPVSYAEKDGVHYILRSAIGYFLPAAVLAKALGVQLADLALYLWTGLGTALFMLSLPFPRQFGWRLLILLTLVTMFSGMDLLGVLAYQGDWPEFPGRLEWWTQFSYSSLAAQLFWAPNHTLPIWLASSLFYRHWHHPDFPAFALLLVALLPVWTPFALPGLAPFLLLAAVQYHLAGNRRLPLLAVVSAILVIALMARFLTLNIGDIPTTIGIHQTRAADQFLLSYLSFTVLEFGALALALSLRLRHSYGILLIAGGTLALLPFLAFGPSNDLLLRASVPALIMLMILTLTVFQPAGGAPERRDTPWLIVVVLAIGAFSPAYEFGRAATVRRWLPDYAPTLIDRQGGAFPAHYVGRLDRADMRLLLRDPVPVPGREQRPASGRRP
ncbi:MAG: hypothetical protein H6942_09725 [Candidatus Accumulibacter sp.]|uniref:hypothetical protein n=1 Tax=Accumulibacter sp. TaxID=2053492 RepID=UPI0025E4AAD4|nr:hypothetical protein [Accumulibacter sp.]MCP5248792.1 hypothetical protein [Accumulibacter sp.]